MASDYVYVHENTNRPKYSGTNHPTINSPRIVCCNCVAVLCRNSSVLERHNCSSHGTRDQQPTSSKTQWSLPNTNNTNSPEMRHSFLLSLQTPSGRDEEQLSKENENSKPVLANELLHSRPQNPGHWRFRDRAPGPFSWGTAGTISATHLRR